MASKRENYSFMSQSSAGTKETIVHSRMNAHHIHGECQDQHRHHSSDDGIHNQESNTRLLVSGMYTERPTNTSGNGNLTDQRHNFWPILTHAFGITCGLAFVGFGIAVLRINGSEVGNEIGQYRNAITVLATSFPILFALVLGRFMTQIAHWKLQNGASMGSLEQLTGSQTVGGTPVVHAHLRALNLLGLAIIIVWTFSPLGAQSLLRMMETSLASVSQPSKVAYFDTDAQSLFVRSTSTGLGYESVHTNHFNFIDTVFNAALLSPDSIKNGTMDLWGNVKIPILSSHTNSTGSRWQDVASGPGLEYSALVGVPIANVSPGNLTFNMESSYLEHDCKNITMEEPSLMQNGLMYTPPRTKLNDSGLCFNGLHGVLCSSVPNGTWQGFDLSDKEERQFSPWSIALDNFVGKPWDDYTPSPYGEPSDMSRPATLVDEDGSNPNPTTLLFQAMLQADTYAWPKQVKAHCGVKQRCIESRIHCSRAADMAPQNCTVTAQRPSQKRHASEDITHLSFRTVWRYVSSGLPVTMSRNTLLPSLPLFYLANPAIRETTGWSSKVVPALDEVSLDKFSARLAQLLNSYVMVSQMYTNIVTGSVDPLAQLSWNTTVTADVENLIEMYVISTKWIALYLLSSLVLLVGGILSCLFTYSTYMPDLLGYASTAVRDSKHVDMAPEMGRLDGLDLTRAMKSQRVRYGHTYLTLGGRPLLGVGMEEDVSKIRPSLSKP